MNHGLNYIKAAAHLEMSIHVDPDNQWVLLAEGTLAAEEGTLAAEEAEAVGGKEYHAWRMRGGSTSIACLRLRGSGASWPPPWAALLTQARQLRTFWRRHVRRCAGRGNAHCRFARRRTRWLRTAPRRLSTFTDHLCGSSSCMVSSAQSTRWRQAHHSQLGRRQCVLWHGVLGAVDEVVASPSLAAWKASVCPLAVRVCPGMLGTSQSAHACPISVHV